METETPNRGAEEPPPESLLAPLLRRKEGRSYLEKYQEEKEKWNLKMRALESPDREPIQPQYLMSLIDKHASDVQDLVFNETWFLAEGLLWGILALMVLGPSPARRWWAGTAIAATAALTATGLLSALHVIGRIVIF